MAVAGALTTWFLSGDAGVALFGGVLTGVLLFAVYFIWYLLLAPAEIHVEQENELAKYVPVQAPKSYRGAIDFIYDINRDISAGQLQKVTEQIGREADRITEQMSVATRKLSRGDKSIAKHRRVAIRMGKEIQAAARRYRRLHKKYKACAAAFAETFEGATLIFVAQQPPEEVANTLREAMAARTATKSLQATTKKTRGSLIEALSGKQEQLSIGVEQLNVVMQDIEKTAGDIVKTFDKIIKKMRTKS